MVENNIVPHTASFSERITLFDTSLPPSRKAQPLILKLSPHSVGMFRECRQRYKFHYIDKLGDAFFRAKPYFTMGNHIHATLRDFFAILPVEARTMQTTEELLRRNWRHCRFGFKNEEDEKRWGKKALAQLERFMSEQDVTAQPFMLEEPLEVELTPGVILRGKVDRVDKEPDGSLHLIDYKTGNLPERIDWLQLHLYALMLSRKPGLPIGKASFYYLSSGVSRTIELNVDELDRAAWELFITAKEIMAEKAFHPNPGQPCKRCDFKSICPKNGYSSSSTKGSPTLF